MNREPASLLLAGSLAAIVGFSAVAFAASRDERAFIEQSLRFKVTTSRRALGETEGTAQRSSFECCSSPVTRLQRAGFAVMSSTQAARSDGSLRVLARDAANLCGVDPALFGRLVNRESEWRHYNAQGGVLTSRSGARGAAQVKPSTARDVSPTLDVDDPWQGLVAGACYLRRQFEQSGSWREALLAYHGGPNRLSTSSASLAYATDILQGANQ